MPTTAIYPRSLHDALPICVAGEEWSGFVQSVDIGAMGDSIGWAGPDPAPVWLDIAREFTERWVHQQHIRDAADRKSTRLNSSHLVISYAVFCLKKKKKKDA